MVEICWDLRSKYGSLLINCYRSKYLSTLSLSVSDITLLHKLEGLMLVDTRISFCIIWVGDGGGGFEAKSMVSTAEGLVSFTFLSLACLVSSLINRLRSSSLEILFLVASIKMLVSLACNSSSYSKMSRRMSLRFPFPFVVLSRHFQDLAISAAICQMFFFVS